MAVKESDTSGRGDLAGGAISRRLFLAISGGTALGARSGASLDPGSLSRPGAGDGSPVQTVLDMEQRGILSPAQQSSWYARMRRCGKINFNEPDPPDVNAEPRAASEPRL